LAAVVIGIMGNDIFLDGATISQISKSDALVLLGFFVIFLYYVYGISKEEEETGENKEEAGGAMSFLKSIIFIIIGLV